MIRYYQAELPARVKAFTVKKDGVYTIVVNSILAKTQQLKEIRHELDHIALGHFDSDKSYDLMEIEVHERQNPPDQGGSSSFPYE